MKRIIILLILVTWSESLYQNDFQKSIWTKKHFGLPQKVHFLEPNYILLIDQNGYGLLNTESNEIEYTRTEKMGFSVLNQLNQFVFYSYSTNRVHIVDPFSDEILKIKPLKHKGFREILLSAFGIYYIKSQEIVFEPEKQGDELLIKFDKNQILKAKIDRKNAESLVVFLWNPEDRVVCQHTVDKNLQVIEKINCFNETLPGSNNAHLIDLIIDKHGNLIKIYNNHYEKLGIKFPFDKDLSSYSESELLAMINEESDSKCVRLQSQTVSEVCISDKHNPIVYFGNGSKPVSIPIRLENDYVINYFLSPDGKLILFSSKFGMLFGFDMTKSHLAFMRDESLGTVKEVLFVSQQSEDSELNYLRKYETLLSSKNFIGAWSLRLANSITSLGRLTTSGMDVLGSFFKHLLKRDWKNALNSVVDLRIAQEGRERIFKTPKIAILFTKVGKIWSFDLEKFKLGGPIKLPSTFKTAHQGTINFSKNHSSHECFISQHGKYELLLNCERNPNIKSRYTLDATLQLKLLVEEKQNSDNENPQIRAPDFTFDVDYKTNLIFGSLNGRKLWQLQIPGEQRLVRLERIQDLKIPHSSFQIENTNVLYKLVDPNNSLLLTLSGQTYFIYIINLKIGKILTTFSTDKISQDHKIKTLVDDNSFFISYYNTETLCHEILNIELFRKRIENDFIKILKAEFGKKEAFLLEINYSNSDPEFITLHKKYALPVDVKEFKAFDSNIDLTAKNLIIVNKNDQIYSLPRAALSSRKIQALERTKIEEQLAKQNKSKIDIAYYFKSLTLEPYDYYLPVLPKQFITKNRKVDGLARIWLEPTAFESTAFLIAAGRELFVTTHSPNSNYDQLPDDFNKPMLWFLLFLFIVSIMITGKIAHAKKPVQKFMAYSN